MSEIKDRQDAASDIDPVVAALADDLSAAAAVEGASADAANVSDAMAAAPGSADPLAQAAGSAAVGALPASRAIALAGPIRSDPPAAATPFEQMMAAHADTIVELEARPGDADDDGPLLDDELEHGIASVFAALHAAAQGDDDPRQPLGEAEAADGVTFRLLGELDRLWHRAA